MTERSRKLTILSGIPGSGKSRLAKQLDGTIISTDAIRIELTGGISDMSANHLVFAIAEARMTRLLQAGTPVIYDATNVHMPRLLRLIARLKAAVYALDITVIVLPCQPGVALQRLARDLARGVNRSVVPDDVVDAMWDNYVNFIAQVEQLTEVAYVDVLYGPEVYQL